MAASALQRRVDALEQKLTGLLPELAHLAQLVSSFDQAVGALRSSSAQKSEVDEAVANLSLGVKAVLEECRGRIEQVRDESSSELESLRAGLVRETLHSSDAEQLRAELAGVRRELGAQIELLSQQREVDSRRIGALEAIVAAHEAQLGDQESAWLDAAMHGAAKAAPERGVQPGQCAAATSGRPSPLSGRLRSPR